MRHVGNDARRDVELADLLQQADLVAAGADDLGTAVADGPIDDPGPDRVHPVDIAEVDRQRVGEPVDLTLGGCGAGDGERPGDPVDRAVPLVVVVLRHLGHRGD